jgi:signal transduction histidine kinase
MGALRLASVVWGLALAALALIGCAPPPPGEPASAFDSAAFVATQVRVPPTSMAHAASARVALPHRWNVELPDHSGFGWYRVEVPARARGDELWAVYLPKLNLNAAVYLDDALIGDGGSFEQPVAQNWNRPLYFTLPPDALSRPARLDIELYAYAGELGGLDPLWIGPDAILRPHYEAQHFARVTMARLATALAILVALLMAALWLGRRRDTMYAYLALAALLFTLTSLNYHILRPPWGHAAWNWLMHTAIDWFAVVGVCFVHRWLGVARPRLEKALVATALASSAILAAVGPRTFPIVATVCHVLALALGGYGAQLIARELRRLPRVEAWFTLAALAATLAVGGHDVLIHVGFLPRDSIRLANFIGVTLVVCFAAIMISRVLRAFREAEELNLTLEARVRHKHAELESTYQRTQRLLAAQLVSQERERIMRDMHDGLGGSLVAALAMVEGGRQDPAALAEALHGALDDMRMVIDSLDPDADDVVTLLGMVRLRMGKRLLARGLSFRWKVTDLPPIPRLGPAEYLHLMRIVQEAIANVIKHAGASVIEVSTSHEAGPPEQVIVVVTDDGCGFDPRQARSGRGLHNMQQRAAAMGATLSVEGRHNGTCVRLSIRLHDGAGDEPPAST